MPDQNTDIVRSQPQPTDQPTLDDRQMEWLVTRVARWITIYETYAERECVSAADAVHSSLLRRLLAGGEPLPKPPPLRFSYPDYDLGEGRPVAVGEPLNTDPLHEHDRYTWVIDQHRGWLYLQEGLYEYKDGSLFRAFRKHNELYLQRVPDVRI